MIRRLLTVILGVLFALGLGISQMSRPQKVLAFLDVLGNWDPTLLVVMGGAIAVYYPLQLWIQKKHLPLYASCYTLPAKKAIDHKLILGAALFGCGWGLLGLCPGPAVVALTSLMPEALIFFLGLSAGIFAIGAFNK